LGQWTSAWWINVLGWLTAAVMFVAAIAMFVV
jgi:Mn2+/Fe2+ NRAMP family transporter